MGAEYNFQVITISRECGAYGHTIAQMVSEKLNIPYYDKDFLAKTVEATGYSKEDVKHEGESMSKRAKFLNDFLGYSASYVSSYDRIHEMQEEVVRDLAKENCIIVGRCADDTLTKAGVPALKVFLYGSMESKLACMKSKYPDVEEKVLKREIEREDIGRETYYKVYTGKKMGDCSNYTICLDTGSIPLEACADIICKLMMK